MQRLSVSLLLILITAGNISCQKKTTVKKKNPINDAAQMPDKFKNPFSAVPFDTVKIHSLIIESTTYTHSYNGTDDAVYVKFNDAMPPYYLDNSGDDREKNQVDRYYIVDKHIKRIGDIKYIKLVKQGHDSWTYYDLKIIVNGQVIFSGRKNDPQGFPVVVVLNEGDFQPEALYVFNTLRSNQFWNLSDLDILKQPQSINRDELIKTMESMVGSSMHYAANGKKYDWDKSNNGHNVTMYGSRSYAEFELFVTENTRKKNLTVRVESSLTNNDAVFDVFRELWPGDIIPDNIPSYLNRTNAGGPGIFDSIGNLSYQ